MAPTGSAACTIHGFTYHNIMNFNFNGDPQTSSSQGRKLEEKTCGTDIFILDEVSMVSCQDLCKINKAFQAKRMASDDLPGNKSALFDQPFAGYHIIFSGDFFQLLPPFGQSLSCDFLNYQSKRVGQNHSGRQLWLNINAFVELKQNYRVLGDNEEEKFFASFLHGAREGIINHRDLLKINNQCFKVSSISAQESADPGALWIAPTNKVVDEFNTTEMVRLIEDEQIWFNSVCYHSTQKKATTSRLCVQEVEISEQLFKVSGCKNKSIPPTVLQLAVGMRVALGSNIGTTFGYYAGALGTVWGFVFPKTSKPPLKKHLRRPGPLHVVACDMAAKAGWRPIVLVKMDELPNNNHSCLVGQERIFPITYEPSYTACIKSGDKSYYRFQIPLRLAKASTIHRCQGLTASNGIVGKLQGTRPAFGPYVMLSRARKLNQIQLLTKLEVWMFNTKTTSEAREYIQREYRRLRQLPQRDLRIHRDHQSPSQQEQQGIDSDH